MPDMRVPLIAFLMLAAIWPTWASPLQPGPPSSLCRSAIAAAERGAGVPERLMVAIGLVESGRRDASGQSGPWPWTINAEGQGRYFESKAEAIAAVRELQARGVRSIDVGCMQVNLRHHPTAFDTLDDAFDPVLNTRYAARFLTQLLAQTGSWPRAVAGYHSLTPEIGDGYAAKVLAVWPRERERPARPEDERVIAVGAGAGSPFAAATGAVRAAAVPYSGATLSMSGGMTARIIALPGASTAGVTGRGLDAYRSNPTRLAVQLMPAGRL